MKRRGFTLIEVIITIAIIGLLVTLFIPSIDRSLSQNNLANDTELLQAKLEEARLLAGSTQQLDAGKGYYGIYLPQADGGTSNRFFSIVRVTGDVSGQQIGGSCTVEAVQAEEPACLVEKVPLSRDVALVNTDSPRFILFRAPTQQLVEASSSGGQWQIVNPEFSWASNVQLKFKAKTATLTIDPYTARMGVTYN